MKLRILQLKGFEKYGFMSYDFACKHGFNLKDYKCVWTENIDSDTDLDQIYTRFNIRRPDGFKGHSLSTSDIIDLEGHMYYCNDIGWKEIN